MIRQPRNRIWTSFHDPVYDFRVIAEFTQRFPHLQFVSFARHTPESVGIAGGSLDETMHSIQFRTDRAGLRALGIPRPKPGQDWSNDYRPGFGPPTWMWHTDARCKLPYVVRFWCERLPASHPMAWLAPARLETTPFNGDLDSLVWGESLREAA